jgi:hypothetical protein
MRKTLVSLAILAVMGSAHALGGNANNSTNVHAAGGAGGNAQAVANGGAGGSASNRTDVSTDVRNTNLNSANAAQHQGQAQGQQQAAISGGNTFSSSVNVEAERIPVSSAIAPSMNPTANCAIPVTGGISAASLAISGGTAYESDTCVTIEQAKVADARGERDVAGEIMCGLDKYRAARKAVGKPCGADVKAAAAPSDAQPVARNGYSGNDPIVLRRLGISN